MNDPASRTLESRLRTALAGQYRVEGLLGQGGMGSVFRAHDEALDRPVAIKVVAPDVAASAELRQRFVQESRTVARLRHPHIVAVYSAGEADGLLYFVMEFVPGESLRDRLTREDRLAEAEAVPILRDIALALDYAHAQGLVHRDVKPENVLLDRDTGRAMLTDFGVARALQGNLQITGAGFVLGSPRYMSPEQASGDADIDGRSDLYSLGLIAVEMLTGAPAVDAPTAASVLVKHLTEAVPSLSESAPATSPAVASAIDRLLAKDRDARWPHGRAFAAAVTGDPMADTPSGPVTRATPTRLIGAASSGKATKTPARGRRGLLVWGGLAIATLASLAVVLSRPAGAREAERAWLVAPFEVQAPDNSLDWLREGGVNMLTLSLEQWRDLKVVEYERTLDLLRDERLDEARRISFDDAERLARRAGVGRVVLGQLTLAGDSLIATATLYDTRAQDVVDRARVAALRTADPRSVFEQLAGDLLNLAGGPRVSLDLARQTTNSVDAYRLYLEGLRSLNSWRLDAADSLFTQAIRRDSTFALAYYRRSLGRGWRNWSDTLNVADAERAVQFAARLPQRQQEIVRGHAELTSAFRLLQRGDPDAARASLLASHERLARLVAVDSLDAEAWYAFADAAYHLVLNTSYGRSPDSTAKYLNQSMRAFQRTIALDSTFHLAYEHLVSMYNQAAVPRAFIVLVGDSIKPGGPVAYETRLGTPAQVEALRNAASVRAREAAMGWIAADPDAVQARKALADNLLTAGMADSAIGVLQAAMARSSTNDPTFAWRILAIRARALRPGTGAEAATMLAATPDDTLRRLAVGERYLILQDAMSIGALTGRPSLISAAAGTMTRATDGMDIVPGVKSAAVALWLSLTMKASMGIPLTVTDRQQLTGVARQLEGLPPQQRDWLSAYMTFLATRDVQHGEMAVRTLAAQGDSTGYPELRALLAIERRDSSEARRLARSFPSVDSLRTSRIGTTGLRMVTRAVVLAELGDVRQALAVLELIDPARFSLSESVETTWAVYVRQFMLRGALYERIGEPVKARQAYERFLELWRDGEAPLEPQLRTAREAVARLRDAAPRSAGTSGGAPGR
ncbi:serine/threonine-protein kinase [Gemmatimonas sp. UBA7669]|uniref:serine/threonine-protein kinase n=1 Tax=Gemmatimonas sp. UBA7669 TaxID=1946568 RepID=UPI0025C5E984|nr:serine/threonine-protein kinase [Gemmatimonas sp. UBA7669]